MVKDLQSELDVPLAYRVRDAARAIGVSRSTLYQLIRSGKLVSTKVAGRRLIPRSALQALIEAPE